MNKHGFIQACAAQTTPETLVEQLHGAPGVVLLHSAPNQDQDGAGAAPRSTRARYSLVTAQPFLTFRYFGSRCETTPHGACIAQVHFGNPWFLLDSLMAHYELLDEWDFPFPLGGCFGYWGYDLKNFVEPKLPRRAVNDLELPDCHLGFYDSLVVFDHYLGKTWIISTGLAADGSRADERAKARLDFWSQRLTAAAEIHEAGCAMPDRESAGADQEFRIKDQASRISPAASGLTHNLSRAEFLSRVERVQAYIRAGDIYQVNLSQRLAVDFVGWGQNLSRGGGVPREPVPAQAGSGTAGRAPSTVNGFCSGWEWFHHLSTASPAPFSAFMDCDDFQIASSSPELFLRLSGRHVQTRPIKGTRPRSSNPTRDAQLTYELQTSAKEMAELVMITDLLRNDLGRVCEFGSVQVPELVRLERYPQVQHLVSTVEGRLRSQVTHLAALASCFPGGSITGAPKFRAMQIIDELEPVSRGPYTGALGYLGFNHESQLSITIRTAICKQNTVYFQVGAGIVADSSPEAEYEETLAKARGFLEALGMRLKQRSNEATKSV